MKVKVSFTDLLFLLFLGLKLGNVIDWSWWWVFSPYLAWVGFTAICGLIIGLCSKD